MEKIITISSNDFLIFLFNFLNFFPKKKKFVVRRALKIFSFPVIREKNKKIKLNRSAAKDFFLLNFDPRTQSFEGWSFLQSFYTTTRHVNFVRKIQSQKSFKRKFMFLNVLKYKLKDTLMFLYERVFIFKTF